MKDWPMIIQFKIISTNETCRTDVSSANGVYYKQGLPNAHYLQKRKHETYEEIGEGIKKANTGQMTEVEKEELFRDMRVYNEKTYGGDCVAATFVILIQDNDTDAPFLTEEQFRFIGGLTDVLIKSTVDKETHLLPRSELVKHNRTSKSMWIDMPTDRGKILEEIESKRRERQRGIPTDVYMLGVGYRQYGSCITGTSIKLDGHVIGIREEKDGSYRIFDSCKSYKPVYCKDKSAAKQEIFERIEALFEDWQTDADRQNKGFGKKLCWKDVALCVDGYPLLKGRLGRTTSWMGKRLGAMPSAIYDYDIRCWWGYGTGIWPRSIIMFPIAVPRTVVRVVKNPDRHHPKWGFP
ncbi:hypothetical protein ACFL96_01915 [Thermoproteota archaeon]